MRYQARNHRATLSTRLFKTNEKPLTAACSLSCRVIISQLVNKFYCLSSLDTFSPTDFFLIADFFQHKFFFIADFWFWWMRDNKRGAIGKNVSEIGSGVLLASQLRGSSERQQYEGFLAASTRAIANHICAPQRTIEKLWYRWKIGWWPICSPSRCGIFMLMSLGKLWFIMIYCRFQDRSLLQPIFSFATDF